jgi:hypothetical protein
LGSQGRKSGGGGGGGGSGGGGSGGGQSVSQTVQNLVRLVKDKKFQLAAKCGVGIALKMTGTDVLADAAVAAAKGYKDAQQHGAESGVKTAAKEFVTRQATGMATDAIAGKAVDSVSGLGPAKEIVKDAISEGLDAAFGSLT